MAAVNTTAVIANGINGRGQLRDGRTVATGRVIGADVTNQHPDSGAPSTK